jgi:hypothetical protein
MAARAGQGAAGIGGAGGYLDSFDEPNSGEQYTHCGTRDRNRSDNFQSQITPRRPSRQPKYIRVGRESGRSSRRLSFCRFEQASKSSATFVLSTIVSRSHSKASRGLPLPSFPGLARLPMPLAFSWRRVVGIGMDGPRITAHVRPVIRSGHIFGEWQVFTRKRDEQVDFISG